MYFLFSVKSILNVKLSEPTGKPSNVSVLDLPGDVLIVPQVNDIVSTQKHFTPVKSLSIQTSVMQTI